MTQRRDKLKGVKIRPSIVAKRFHGVEQYLNWLMHSSPNTAKTNDKKLRQKQEGLLGVIIADIFEEVCKDNVEFEKQFELEDLFNLKKGVLVKKKDGEFMLRLNLKRTGVKDTFQMIVGHINDVPKGKALVQLNQSLPMEEKSALGRWMQSCLDGDYISPVKLANWACPAVTKALKAINKRVIYGYEIRTIIMLSKDGLETVIACKYEDDNEKSFSAKIFFDIGVPVDSLPNQFKLHCFSKKGRDMISKVKCDNIQISLHAPLVEKLPLPDWYKNGSLLKLNQRERTKMMLSVPNNNKEAAINGSLMSRSNTALIGGKKPTEDLFWKVDIDAIERGIHSRVKLEASYIMIKEVFTLYNILVNYGNKVLLPLNKDTKQALSLYLYAEAMDSPNINFMIMLKRLLKYVKGCMECGYCPYFCKPQENTMGNTTGEVELDENDEDNEETDESIEQQKEVKSIVKLLKLIKKNDVTQVMQFTNIY